MAILRVSKDVTLLREKHMSIVKVRNDVIFIFYTRSSSIESTTLDYRESKCFLRGPEILMRTNNYKQSQSSLFLCCFVQTNITGDLYNL